MNAPDATMVARSGRNEGAMTRALTLLFAVAGGAAVGNLYWAQPLLEEIARSLGVSVGAAGLLVTVTQIGYAVGIFLVVPLGDVLNRRRLIPAVAGRVLGGAVRGVAPRRTSRSCWWRWSWSG